MADKCLDPQKKEPFSHRSGDPSFLARVDSVFSALGTLEKKHEASLSETDVTKRSDEIKTDEVEEESVHEVLSESSIPAEVRGGNDEQSSKNVQSTDAFCGLKSKRKRPPRVPDHVLHPDKWKKYSLEDDGTEKIGLKGDALNQSIALEFLRELKCQKVEQPTSSTFNLETDCNPLHDFKSKKLSEKHADIAEDIGQEDAAKTCNTNFVGTTVQMPMYEIGMKHSQPKNQDSKIKETINRTPGQVTELSLSHLTPQDILDINQESLKTKIRRLEKSGTNIDSESSVEDCKQTEDSPVTFKSKKRNRLALRKRADEAEEIE